MAQLLTDDDELDLEDEQKKKQAAQGDTIGKPLTYKDAGGAMPSPEQQSSTVPANMPAPEVGAASPSAQTVSEVAPYNPPSPTAPRPESDAFTNWQAKELHDHPVDKPRYHGLARVADTIAQMTWPGQAAEIGGEFGTLGAQAKSRRLAGNAAEENTQIGYGEKERQADALEEEERAKAQGEETGNTLQSVDTPAGPKNVMTKNIASPTAAIINSSERLAQNKDTVGGRQAVADTNAGARTDVADINAGAKEATAKIMVGGKPMATKEIQGPDGKAHVMMWNPTTHTYDRDLGEAPPHAAASSAYANTRTVNLIDPDSGLPTTFQYNADTGTYDKPLGTSATGAYGHEVAQAGAVERAGTALIDTITANKDKLGDVGALWNAAFTGTPLSDPVQSGIAAQIASFAALNPALHGARGVAAMQEFEKIYGSPVNNPDSLIAAIQAGLKTAGYVKGNPSQKPTQKPTNPNAPQNPSGTVPRFSDFVKGVA